MQGFEITCVNKNQSGMIIRVGGENWSMGGHDVVLKLLTEQIRLYLRLEDELFQIGVRGESSDAYLTIEPDGTPLHDLHNLPSC